ncbi:MAG: aldo/keto reductase [Gammaproteobacteria bacterium]
MATKVWTQGLQAGIEQMRESMRKLRVQGLDLMQIHDLVDLRAHWRTLSPWKSEGKIRSAGITTSHEHDELAALLSRYPFDFVQLSYNIKDREVEKRLLGIALDCGIAVLVNRPFQRGSCSERSETGTLPDGAGEIDCRTRALFFMKFVVSHPAVTCAIPATSRKEPMLDIMEANFGKLPDQALRSEMEKYFLRL